MSDRLNAIYERLNELGSSTAEVSRAVHPNVRRGREGDYVDWGRGGRGRSQNAVGTEERTWEGLMRQLEMMSEMGKGEKRRG